MPPCCRIFPLHLERILRSQLWRSRVSFQRPKNPAEWQRPWHDKGLFGGITQRCHVSRRPGPTLLLVLGSVERTSRLKPSAASASPVYISYRPLRWYYWSHAQYFNRLSWTRLTTSLEEHPAYAAHIVFMKSAASKERSKLADMLRRLSCAHFLTSTGMIYSTHSFDTVVIPGSESRGSMSTATLSRPTT
jgi:hypothetical protein